METGKEHAIGVWYSIIAYVVWGVLPIYWKLVDSVPPDQILAHRIIWSLVFMAIILIFINKWKVFLKDVKTIFSNKKLLTAILLSSITISINWFIYIWSVNTDRVVEASLGYYINPLISVLLGIIVLKEKLSFWQLVSFCLAAIGVANLTFQHGSIPWAAITLAVSFGFYGLFKKKVNLGSLTGLAVETLMIAPIAIFYLLFTHISKNGAFSLAAPSVSALLIGAGIATAVPLLLFASGARRIPLSMVGFLQYIAPTIQLLLGIFLFHEPFTSDHLISFIFIWTALTIFSIGRTKLLMNLQPRVFKKAHPSDGNQKASSV